MTFGNHVKQLIHAGLYVSVALGIVIGVALFISGGTEAEIDLTLEFDRYDGVWFVVGLPLLALLVSLLLSPLSYGIHWLLARRKV